MNKKSTFRLFLLLLLISGSLAVQAQSFMQDYIQRWELSKKYLIAVATLMPENDYKFKPVEAEKTFGEQLTHICIGIDWHAQMLIKGRKEEEFPAEQRLKKFNAAVLSKQQIIDLLAKTFDEATEVMKNFDSTHLEDTVTFLNKTRTKLRLFLLLTDHVTHHRAQLLVYLRMIGIQPPEYVDYQ